MGRLIDLTHTFTDDMPVYPGDPCSRLYQCCTIENEGVSDHKIESCMHVGTHIDAPLHMIEGGAYISEIPLDKCEGRGVLIDARGHNTIDADLVEQHTIQSGDIVLFWTGWGKKFRDADYFENWPVLTPECGNALAERKVHMVGMDIAGPDIDESFPVHKILLAQDILIAENLTNLDALENIKNFIVRAQPMKYEADAAPARIYAEVLDNE